MKDQLAAGQAGKFPTESTGDFEISLVGGFKHVFYFQDGYCTTNHL
jgi:hypothetical protein